MEQVKTKRRAGRPPKMDCEKRAIVLRPGFTPVEAAQLDKKAQGAGVDVIEYLRSAGLGRAILSVPEINRTAYAELANLANNLNQLTKIAHQQPNFDGSAMAAAMVGLHKKVQALRAALLGRSS